MRRMQRIECFVKDSDWESSKSKCLLVRLMFKLLLESGMFSIYNQYRPRNAKEIKENSQNIINTPNSKELIIKTLNECSKTYTFDKVIGPDASQEQVYDQVMSGMLSEVLEGYNVTVFAYGQTGTGKTFTMLGDEPSSANAGIIPRSLITLFQSLEKDVAEYSVRVSVFYEI